MAANPELLLIENVRDTSGLIALSKQAQDAANLLNNPVKADLELGIDSSEAQRAELSQALGGFSVVAAGRHSRMRDPNCASHFAIRFGNKKTEEDEALLDSLYVQYGQVSTGNHKALVIPAENITAFAAPETRINGLIIPEISLRIRKPGERGAVRFGQSQPDESVGSWFRLRLHRNMMPSGHGTYHPVEG